MKTTEQLTVDRILSIVAEYKASDLHLSVGNPPIVRVDGKLMPLQDEQLLTPEFLEKMLLSFLDEGQKKRLAKEREVVIAYSFQNKARFKISIYYQKGYLGASLRYISEKIKTLRELNLPTVVENFTKLKRGLVIITGPFGSGKSTTIASLINAINKERAEHILTIEQPIEYLFVNNKSIIEQREVGRDTLSFEQALDSTSQEDVNVVMVSEMEEPQVIEEGLNVAASGRLVIVGFNTDSVFKTVEKIIQSFEPHRQEGIRTQLADVLEGVVSQRILPRVGGGRVLVCEVLIPNSAVRTVIREGAIYQLNNILQTSREEGMISLDRSLAELVRNGEILIDEALSHALDRNNLKMMMRER